MARVIKTFIGIILLSISAFYLLGIALSIGEAEQTLAYNADCFLQVECLSVEKIGGSYVNNAGETEEAWEDHVFYRVNMKAENLSSERLYGALEDRVSFRGVEDEYGDVRMMRSRLYSSSYLFADEVSYALPGKTETEFPVYLEVKKGVKEIKGYYTPNSNEDELELGIIQLD